MFICFALLVWLFLSSAKRYRKNPASAPKGKQNALEVFILFIRDDVVKPVLGTATDRYLPFLLTVFFFIWINNMLGLIPGLAANVTGNIAVTMTLALFSFIIILFSSNKYYWSHIFNPPGVPVFVKPILILVEFIGVFIKPTALTIRLFANMVAGHMIILSIVCMIFIFSQMNVAAGAGFSVVTVAFGIFMTSLELLVALLQAYIFTFLSALFISQAIEVPHHGEHH
jgi:F-type H+-transporting ATPase subunit a